MPPDKILYTFYGDDFTGSTDVLEQLGANGIPSVLFLAPPTAAQLRQFSAVRAFGIAGDSRSRSPAWMSEHLPKIFASLRGFGPPVVHYKVCSTFDSSAAIGSIGHAIEIGLDTFAPTFVPIVIGAPHLRRFVLDGQLFASAPDGNVHRIDRHPMRDHPVTPMREPDVRRHLAAQTHLPIGLIADESLHSLETAAAALDRQIAQGFRVVLFDTVDSAALSVIGRLLWRSAQQQPLFAAASSGLATALVAAWRAADLLMPPAPAVSVAPASPLLVVSGSCSATTARQIEWALDHGFHGIQIDPTELTAKESARYRQKIIDAALHPLESGHDVVLYTALGRPTSASAGETLGAALGAIIRDILHRVPVNRIVLCGGDTSSHAAQQLGLSALTWSASLQPGAPLCRAHFLKPNTPPLELVLKGGQVGTDDFFACARGTTSTLRCT